MGRILAETNCNQPDAERQLRPQLRSRSEMRMQQRQMHLQVDVWSISPASATIQRELFPDIPLPSSFAEPFNPEMPKPIQIKERLYGQKLYGTMIPKRQLQVDESHSLFATKEKVFIDAGLGNYYDDACKRHLIQFAAILIHKCFNFVISTPLSRFTDGWASFVNVTKVTYMIGYGVTKGRVYAKTNSNVASLFDTQH